MLLPSSLYVQRGLVSYGTLPKLHWERHPPSCSKEQHMLGSMTVVCIPVRVGLSGRLSLLLVSHKQVSSDTTSPGRLNSSLDPLKSTTLRFPELFRDPAEFPAA